MLSKSKFTRGMNCQKSLWLYFHKYEEREVSDTTQAVFETGKSVGELAREYFPNGEMALLENYPGFESAKRTQEFIKNGVETIYEATFIFDNTLVAVDLLTKIDNEWHLFEVKSTNSVKEQHILDVAVQYYVLIGTGLPVKQTHIMHLDREYICRGDIDVKGLFTYENVQIQVDELQEEIEKNIKILSLLEKEENEPMVEMEIHCIKPYMCDFYNYCTTLLPKVDTETIELSSMPEVKHEELKSYIDEIQYPLYYLDFETIMPAIPLFNESRPYQQIPFQYSLHHQNSESGEVFHDYYLAENNLNVDPRIALIKQMIEQTRDAKTILVYSIIFERTRIKEMIRDFPQYETGLQSIIDRMVDLIIPFKKHFYRTQTMEGSSSIKKVLPALCPEFSYDDLEIGSGMVASNTFLSLYYCKDENIINNTRENLLTYCHLDTLAMVKIFDVLINHVNSK